MNNMVLLRNALQESIGVTNHLRVKAEAADLKEF